MAWDEAFRTFRGVGLGLLGFRSGPRVERLGRVLSGLSMPRVQRPELESACGALDRD